ncbi:glycosyltransferase [Phytopseudomonas dryadis]|uniref:Glycosyl transferase n=1 Tax=Phytopseudomonas dryadis TaxID=2487520 RepID=A0A4Q9QW58_9GAMM|nr:glycosyltransferase [Pseudomonas dryadis]TBU87110.1 glycosyl transferase [Pseudomonas dryadis]
MIGIVIPAHNEELFLDDCLESVLAAAGHGDLTLAVRILVVLDDCSDGSAAVAANYPVETLALQARNVGIARATGVDWLLRQGATWIACTDADSQVAADWLSSQLALNADVVCGTVQVADWGDIQAEVQARYQRHYHADDGHRHIHGANLAFSADAYRHAGGFSPLPVDEDVQLVRAFERNGARIAWSTAPRVTTSARLECRTSGGFGDYLKSLLQG